LSPVTSYMFWCLLCHLQGDHCIICSRTICFLHCCYIGCAIEYNVYRVFFKFTTVCSSFFCILTPCRQAMQKCVIAIPCIVDESRISMFSYTMSCTSVCQLVWLTFRFNVIDSLMQDDWISSYK